MGNPAPPEIKVRMFPYPGLHLCFLVVILNMPNESVCPEDLRSTTKFAQQMTQWELGVLYLGLEELNHSFGYSGGFGPN